jgi:hypothetical protein
MELSQLIPSRIQRGSPASDELGDEEIGRTVVELPRRRRLLKQAAAARQFDCLLRSARRGGSGRAAECERGNTQRTHGGNALSFGEALF